MDFAESVAHASFLQRSWSQFAQWRSLSYGLGHVALHLRYYGTCSILGRNGLDMSHCRGTVPLDGAVRSTEDEVIYDLDAR
jgi:hypothetical protein